jgi:TolB-like protein
MTAGETPRMIDLAREEAFALGPLKVRPSMHQLEINGRSESLQPRIMQVLVTLARQRGQVVPRDELVATCWGGRAVSEDAINRCIQAVRRLAEVHGGFCVVTVTRVGYRLDETEAALTPSTIAGPLLAVLAFDNLSGDPESAYFSDGVSEEIQQAVARGARLRVIGRGSSFQFRGADKAAAHIADRTRATHVLDGSVRRDGQRVRISVQLVECAHETTLWSERFDRDLSDVFALQDEIAAEVAAALKTAFAPMGAASPVDPGAYDLYLRARDEATPLGAAERVEMLERVVALAPGFALAWVKLADWRINRAQEEGGRLAPAPLLDEVRAALEAAERLDPGLGATRIVRAWLEPYASFTRREALFREALRLAPGDAECLTGMSRFLGHVGRRREASVLAEEAGARDPLSAYPQHVWMTLSDVDYQTKMARYDTARARWPASFDLNFGAAYGAALAGDWPKYETLARHALAQPNSEPQAGLMRQVFQRCEALRDGDKAYFDRLVGEIEGDLERSGIVRLDRAMSAARAGRIEETFAAVDRASFDAAFEPGGGHGGSLAGGWGAGPIFDMSANGAMIRDQRFVRLCAKLGLVSYWLETDKWPDCADAVPYDFRAEAHKVGAMGLARLA